LSVQSGDSMRFYSVVGNEISITIDAQQVAAMKSEKPSLRLAASAAPDRIGGLDDNARFANVVMPHIDDAYRLAHWLTGNSTDAEDVVQDASLRAFRAIRRFAGGSAARGC
jgi:hypothetical protein